MRFYNIDASVSYGVSVKSVLTLTVDLFLGFSSSTGSNINRFFVFSMNLVLSS